MLNADDKSRLIRALEAAELGAREAERNGFGWGYWQFDSDFVAWDMSRDAWFEPVRKALITEE